MNPQRERIFRDERPPHEIVHQIEAQINVVFNPANEAGVLVYRAVAMVIGLPYRFVLRFEGALPDINCYRLHIEADVSQTTERNKDYYLKSAESWFDLWTESFPPAPPALTGQGSHERYQALCRLALDAHPDASSVAAVQRAIIQSLKNGDSFATAHKEGGTTIRWLGHRFQASDYGESDAVETFDTEAAFLQYLRQFYHWTVTSAAPPGTVTELQAWTLIQRQLRRQRI